MTKLENISNAIKWVLFTDGDSTDDDMLFIVERLNQIFGTKLTINLTADDLALDDLTISQFDQLKNLIEDLQERHILSPTEPCDHCGKYFEPEEDMYETNEGHICNDCWNKRFETTRDWDEYCIKANLGEDDPDNIFSPIGQLLHLLSDDEVANLADETRDNDAVAFFTQAAD